MGCWQAFAGIRYRIPPLAAAHRAAETGVPWLDIHHDVVQAWVGRERACREGSRGSRGSMVKAVLLLWGIQVLPSR